MHPCSLTMCNGLLPCGYNKGRVQGFAAGASDRMRQRAGSDRRRAGLVPAAPEEGSDP